MKRAIIIFVLLLKVSMAQAFDPVLAGLYLNSLEDSIFANLFASSNSEETPEYVPAYVARKVAFYIEFYATEGHDTFQQWLNQAALYLPVIKEILREEGVPEDLAFLPLIESGFNVNARSPKKATGMWQFMASTAALYGLKINKWVDERKDPIKSTRAAARHLRDLYETFGTWPLALASYNAGMGRVSRALSVTGASTFWNMGQSRALRAETRNYIPKFMAALIITRNPEAFGFTIPEENILNYDLIEVPGGMDLRTIAKLADITYSTLRKLNPGLKGHITPFEEPFYHLRLPQGTGITFLANFEKLPAAERIVYKEHRVKTGDTVSEIARRYGTSISAIKKVNNLDNRYTIIQGNYLLVPARLPFDEVKVRLLTTSNKEPDT